MAQSMAEHTLILTSLTEGNEVAAAEALRSHVKIQSERFHDLLASYETVQGELPS